MKNSSKATSKLTHWHWTSILLAVLAWTASSLPSTAQGIDSLFVQAPRSVLPLLDLSARLDLLDLYNNHLTAKVENNCGGQSEMLAKTPSHLLLKTSDAATWELSLLTSPADTLLLCLQTLKAGGKSSRISLFGPHWKADSRKLPTLCTADFWCPPVGLDENLMAVYRKQAEMLPICAEWNDATSTLLFTLSTDGVDLDERENLAKCLCPVKVEIRVREGCFEFHQM